MYAETEFTLDEASKYDKNDDEIPDDSGDGAVSYTHLDVYKRQPPV